MGRLLSVLFGLKNDEVKKIKKPQLLFLFDREKNADAGYTEVPFIV